jgi:hypothetical protein
MINAHDAGIRQATCFLRVARIAQELYTKGSRVAVDFFDAEAENIRAAEDWVGGRTVDNDKGGTVSDAFSTLGERLVGLRLNPRKHPRGQEAEENVRAALQKFDDAFPQIKLAQKWVMENAVSDLGSPKPAPTPNRSNHVA